MWNSFIKFIVRYEYARGQFDLRAANRFSDENDTQTAAIFKELAITEINHGGRFSKLINFSINRNRFFSRPEWTTRHDQSERELPIAGLSLQKWWTRFLFGGKSVCDFESSDIIAICAAAEFLETNIYRFLSIFGGELGQLSGLIAVEEDNAHRRLVALCKSRLCTFKLAYWHIKAILALFILIITLNTNFPLPGKTKE